jgi:WD40 repeat protein
VKQSDTHQWHEKKRFSNVKAFISDDSKWIVTIDENAKAEVWDIEKGISKHYLKKETIHKASFSPNSQWLVTTDTTKDIHTHKIWDIDKGTKNHEFKSDTTISDKPLSKYFSKDGRWFEEKPRKNLSKIRDLDNKKYLFEEPLSDVSFSSDSQWIAVISGNKEAKLWNVKSNVDIQECEISYLKGKSVEGISFSPDSRWLITKYNRQNRANIWSLKDFQKPSFLNNETFYAPYFSPNDKWLVTRNGSNTENCTSKVWDMSKCVMILNDTLPDVEFSPDNQWLVNKKSLTGDYFQLEVWDITNKSRKDFLQNEKDLYRYSFSPDSSWLISKHKNFSKIWDLKTGQQIHKFSNTSDSLKSIVKIEISNDCQWVFILDKNNRAKIWNTQKERWYDFLQGERDIRIAKFFSNNELLLTKDDFGVVKIWTLASKGNDAKKAFEKIENDIKKIQEWIRIFGDKYLLPLDEELKKKYGIKD